MTEKTYTGAMAVSEWTDTQARQYLPVAEPKNGYGYNRVTPDQAAAKNARRLDVFSAMYGLDSRYSEAQGKHSAECTAMLNAAEALSSWHALKVDAEARPWKCAAAAVEVEEAISRSFEQREADAQEEIAKSFEQKADDLEKKAEEAKKAAEEAKGDSSEDSSDSDGEGADSGEASGEGSESEADSGEQGAEGGSEADSSDSDSSSDSSAGDSQGKESGSGNGSESSDYEAKARAAEVADAKAKEARKDADKYRGWADRAAEDAETALQNSIAQGIKNAEQKIEQAEEAMEVLTGGKGNGSEECIMNSPTAEVAKLLTENPDFAKMLKWAGRMAMTGRAKAKQRRGRGASNVVNVISGGVAEIADAIPTELLGLIDPELETLLDAAIADESLDIEEYRGNEPEERGPVVVCLDESSSMKRFNGAPRDWSKAVALAMFLRCREENRPFAAVRFSNEWKTVVRGWKNPRYAKFSEVYAWIGGFLNGGTSINAALINAREFIHSNPGFKKSDIMLITDGEDRGWETTAETLRSEGTSIYGVAIGEKWSDYQKAVLEEGIELAAGTHLSESPEKTISKLEDALAV